MTRIFLLAAAAMLCWLPSPLLGQPVTQPPELQVFVNRLGGNPTLERFLQNVRSEFRQLDADGDGQLRSADADIHAWMAASAQRAMVLTMVMRADLDGDGTVTEEEIRRVLAYDRRSMTPAGAETQREQQIEAAVKQMLAADANRDGRVTVAEVVAFAKAQADQQRGTDRGMGRVMSERIRQMIALAGEGKDVVTLAEIEPRAEALFRTVDADGNGTVAVDELKAYRERPQAPGAETQQAAQQAAKLREERIRQAEAVRLRKEQELRAGCEMPKASDSAKVVVLSAYESDALANVTIGSQDVATRTGTVNVEAGNEPVYVVMVTFRPVIWRFTGATDRIERVVLAGHNTRGNGASPDEVPLTGLTGIAKERVTFLQKPNCLGYFTETPSGKAAGVLARVRQDTGKDAAAVGAHYAVAGFDVPSAVIRQSERDRSRRPMLVIRKQEGSLVIKGDADVVIETGRDNLSSEFQRFYPGGMVSIDPATVVASRPVEAYEVLPNQAGLIQLVKSGALKQNRGGEFLITRKIRFPAELHGAHSARFLLLKGVPEPDGDPGHSCVISEETGAPLGGGPRGICR